MMVFLQLYLTFPGGRHAALDCLVMLNKVILQAARMEKNKVKFLMLFNDNIYREVDGSKGDCYPQ